MDYCFIGVMSEVLSTLSHAVTPTSIKGGECEEGKPVQSTLTQTHSHHRCRHQYDQYHPRPGSTTAPNVCWGCWSQPCYESPQPADGSVAGHTRVAGEKNRQQQQSSSSGHLQNDLPSGQWGA